MNTVRKPAFGRACPRARGRGLPLAVVILTTILSGSLSAQSTMKISQVFGGGGLSGCPYTNDFVELYNTGAFAKNLNGWSLQYSTAFGTTWSVVNLSGTVQAGHYYLIKLGQAAGTVAQAPDLPAADATATLDIGASTAKLAIVSSTTPLAGGTPTGQGIVDFLGYGPLASWREPFVGGSLASNSIALTADIALFRRGCGTTDTDNNASDFTRGAPAPRNTQTPANLGLSGVATAQPWFCSPGQMTRIVCTPRLCGGGLNVGTLVAVDLSLIGGAAVQTLFDDGTNGDDIAGDGVFTYLASVAPGTTAGTKTLPAAFSDGVNSGGGCLGVVVTPAGTTPQNDNCMGATVITGPFPASVGGTLSGANVEWNQFFQIPADSMLNKRGVWYRVTGNGTTLNATTCATSPAFDSVIVVATGTCEGLTLVGSNNDNGPGCSGTGGLSSVSWCSANGAPYFIWVGHNLAGPQSNAFTLTVSDDGVACTNAIPTTVCPLSQPPGAILEPEASLGPDLNSGCDGVGNMFTDVTLGFVPTIVRGSARAFSSVRDTDWYRFQASATENFAATVQAQFSGVLSIRSLSTTGTCVTGTVLAQSMASNRCGSVSASTIVYAGSWYAVRFLEAPTPTVFGGVAAGGLSDNYLLTLALGAAPANDQCANAMPLPLGTAGITSWLGTSATNDGTSSCDGTGRDIWYTLTVPQSGVYALDTCGSTVDTVLTVFSGCGGAEIACNDDCVGTACGSMTSCLKNLPLTAGSYTVRVSDKGLGMGGVVTVRWYLGNDNCIDAFTVTCPSTTAGFCGGASIESPAPPSCTGPEGPGVSQNFAVTAGVWYRYAATAQQTVTVDTIGSAFDTKLFVYAGSCGALTCIVANDNIEGSISKCAWITTPGVDYLILVSAANPATATTFFLNLTGDPTPPNDSCATPTPLTPASGGSLTGTTRGATPILWTNNAFTTYPTGSNPGSIFDVWYSYTAPADGTITIDTCGLLDTFVSVHLACPNPNGPDNAIAQNDNGDNGCSPGSRVFFGGTTGVTYWIRICGSTGTVAGDTFTITWSVVTDLVFYRDQDGDGFGDPAVTIQAPAQPPGYVTDNSDCDDADPSVHPGATEICNGIDDNCDGLVDDDDPATTGQPTWYADADGDGFGNPAAFVVACAQPAGFVTDNSDCNDGNAAVHPGAPEICNGIDDDCNGLVDGADPAITGQPTWYVDADGDGFGSPASTVLACAQPVGYVANALDCDDGNAAVHPGAPEICNGIDDDCNGLIDGADPAITGQATFYADADGDGFGNPAVSVLACSQPAGYVANALDCDDGNAAVHPGATEICNGVDDNCNGLIDGADPAITRQPTWYLDADGDGFGNSAVSVLACAPPAGYVANALDCDDGNAAVHPGAPEICNGVDDDCNGLFDEGVAMPFWLDADGDGFGDAANFVLACTPPQGHVANDADCDDTNPNVHPGAPEICNLIDDDCNGEIDDGVMSTFYRDQDGDGFGDAAVTTLACNAAPGWVANAADCSDADPAVHPGAPEICNGIDDNCDGLIDDADPTITGQPTWYQDADGDGYGNPALTAIGCTAPAGFVSNNLDCNDGNAAIHPGATELCNGIDDDCSGEIDEACQGADTCVTAAPITDGVTFATSSAATTTPALPPSCGPTACDVWFTYTNPLGCPAKVVASLCPADGGSCSFDSSVAVWQGDCSSLSLLACDTGACGAESNVHFNLAGGATVRISVSVVDPMGPILPHGGPFALAMSSVTAASQSYGFSCPNPMLALIAGLPQLGSVASLQIVHAEPLSAAYLLYSEAYLAGPFYPVECTFAWVDPFTMQLLTVLPVDANGEAVLSLLLPSEPALECFQVSLQAAIFGQTGLSGLTNGVWLNVGH